MFPHNTRGVGFNWSDSSFVQLGPKRIHKVRTRGGNIKYRAMRLDAGNFSWGSECELTAQKYNSVGTQ